MRIPDERGFTSHPRLPLQGYRVMHSLAFHAGAPDRALHATGMGEADV